MIELVKSDGRSSSALGHMTNNTVKVSGENSLTAFRKINLLRKGSGRKKKKKI